MHIIVEGNRKVEVSRIHQWKTYAGVVDGMPGPEMNSLMMENARISAKNEFNLDAIYLIEPIQTPVEGWLYSGNCPVKLPPITCIAKLTDHAHYPDGDYGCLGIVWFQNEFAFPIEDQIKQALLKVPFSKLADTFYYF